MNCETCRFFARTNAVSGMGVCRRFPPQVVSFQSVERCYDRWPEVHSRQWCGEYQEPRPAPSSLEPIITSDTDMLYHVCGVCQKPIAGHERFYPDYPSRMVRCQSCQNIKDSVDAIKQ